MRRALLLAVLIAGGLCGLGGTPVAVGQCMPCDTFGYHCQGGVIVDSGGPICPGQSVLLTAVNAIPPCSWSPTEGLTDPQSCVTTAQPSHTIQYLVTYVEAHSHCFVTPGASIVVLPASPTPTITAPASALQGQVGLAASVPVHEGPYFASSYEWTIFNGEITSGQGTHAITFSAARSPVKVDGKELGIQLSLVESPIGACDSAAATTTVALAPLRNPRVIPFR
jgi:hypothetical protein